MKRQKTDGNELDTGLSDAEEEAQPNGLPKLDDIPNQAVYEHKLTDYLFATVFVDRKQIKVDLRTKY